MILEQDFYFQKTEVVAEKLLGKILFHKKEDGQICCGRIVETEAYLGVEDPAAHTFGGRKSDRNGAMYLEGGHSYVYFIYGMYHCLNFVTRGEGQPEAVLIRALEPVPLSQEKVAKKHMHTNGPGKLCRHFEITRQQNALKLWKKRSGLWVEDDGFKVQPKNVCKVPRIGVDYAGDAAKWPLRFYLKNSAFVSRQ